MKTWLFPVPPSGHIWHKLERVATDVRSASTGRTQLKALLRPSRVLVCFAFLDSIKWGHAILVKSIILIYSSVNLIRVSMICETLASVCSAIVVISNWFVPNAVCVAVVKVYLVAISHLTNLSTIFAISPPSE